MSHTPGPFEVRPSSKPGNGTAWRDIVSLGGPFAPSYVGEALEQDAVLFAASPAMLEAATWVCRLYGTEHPEGLSELKAWVGKLRDSVKAARGNERHEPEPAKSVKQPLEIAIVMEGGCIVDVYANQPIHAYEVFDYDDLEDEGLSRDDATSYVSHKLQKYNGGAA